MDHMHSRQITTPTANHSFLQAGCSSWCPPNSVWRQNLPDGRGIQMPGYLKWRIQKYKWHHNHQRSERMKNFHASVGFCANLLSKNWYSRFSQKFGSIPVKLQLQCLCCYASAHSDCKHTVSHKNESPTFLAVTRNQIKETLQWLVEVLRCRLLH